MNLKFMKNEGDIIVKFSNDGTEKDFKYTEMIDFLFNSGELAESEFIGEFSDDEKVWINNMIGKMKGKIAESSQASTQTEGV
jgi:hypothetical protein